jgi:hypothetical protein
MYIDFYLKYFFYIFYVVLLEIFSQKIVKVQHISDYKLFIPIIILVILEIIFNIIWQLTDPIQVKKKSLLFLFLLIYINF